MPFDEKSLKPVTIGSHFKMPRAYVHPPRMHHKSHEAGGKDEIDLSGLSGHDEHAIHDNIDEEIYDIAEKARPVDADILVIEDSEDDWAKKKIPLSQTKRYLLYNQTIDATTSVGDLIYNDGTNWKPAEADDPDTIEGLIGIYLDDNDVLLWGLYTTTGLTANSTYWASATAGEITTDKPEQLDDRARVIGQAITTELLFFRPDGNWEVIEKIPIIPSDSLSFDTIGADHHSLVMIDETHFMLAYRRYGSGYHKSMIATFYIDYDSIELIEVLDHDPAPAHKGWNSLVKIDPLHFILAYTVQDVLPVGTDNGRIKTFSIDVNYENITQIDVIANGYSIHNSLVKIDSTHFLLSSAVWWNNLKLQTISIDALYDNITVVDSDSSLSKGIWGSIVKISSTHYVLAYMDSGDDGNIVVITVDGSWNMAIGTPLEHDTSYGGYNSLVVIDSTHVGLAYAGYGGKGVIKIFEISGTTVTEVSNLEHDTVGTYNSMAIVGTSYFVLAYQGVDSDGFIKVFGIDSSYAITEEGKYEHDTTYALWNSFVKINFNKFLLAYTKTNFYGHGVVKIFEIGL